MKQCKICNGEAEFKFNRMVTREDLAREAPIFICEDCGFLFTTAWDDADEDTMNKLYKYPEYLKYDIGARRQRRLHRSYYLVRYLIEKYIVNKPKILMYGSGTCLSPHWLRQDGLDVWTCYDHLEDWDRSINVADTKQKFDLIVSTEVAEHFVFPLKEFELGVNLLKKDGVFAGSTCFFNRKKKTLQAIMNDAHHYTHDYHWNGGLCSMYTVQAMQKIADTIGCINLTERGSKSLRKTSQMPGTSYFFQLQKQ